VEKYSLTAMAATQRDVAAEATAGRGSVTLVGGPDRSLRQTLLALIEGQEMHIQHSPEEATLLVIVGGLTVSTSDESVELAVADLLVLPQDAHIISARTDTTALLTVAKGDYPD
jgi:quercetin dioxygenase-like cupin family protein